MTARDEDRASGFTTVGRARNARRTWEAEHGPLPASGHMPVFVPGTVASWQRKQRPAVEPAPVLFEVAS